ncbi:MAG: efflux RND transporter periplasmic adaptor subunit [Verrucomicrobiota bacterium]
MPVRAARAQARNVAVEIEAVGNVQAYSSVSVRSRVTGELFKVHFREGEEVKAGDLLFTIDPRSSEATLRQAQAATQRDAAQLESARLDFERVKQLAQNGIASKDEYDKSQAAFQALEATVVADRAAVSNAVLYVDYTQIRSPIDGRTGNLEVKEGNIVKSEDDRLVVLNQLRPIYVAFAVPEQELAKIRQSLKAAALPVMVTLPDSTNVVARGQLTFIDNNVDVTTGTILLKATFPNESEQLWPGQFVQVRLTVSTIPDATVVPSEAVQTSQSGDFVFVVQADQTVEKRPVTLGVSQEGWVVIAQGVKSGETVVTDGQMRLVPKAKVNVQEMPGPHATQTAHDQGIRGES